LKKIANNCNECINKNRISPDIIVRADDNTSPRIAEYNKLTHKNALIQIIAKCEMILIDFRMNAIVGN
jgi:hypothetical protein